MFKIFHKSFYIQKLLIFIFEMKIYRANKKIYFYLLHTKKAIIMENDIIENNTKNKQNINIKNNQRQNKNGIISFLSFL